MKLLIDHLTSTTGWTVTAPTTITTNTYPQFVAGLNTTSLLIFFSSADTTHKAVKTFSTPFDVSSYETLIFSIWSRDKGKQEYNKASDFNYKLTINSTNIYYLPIYDHFTHIEIGIEDVSQITKIQIEPIHTDNDYIIISEMVVEKEELPLDILNDVIEGIDDIFADDYSVGINVGTVTSAAAGATSIVITGSRDFLERYAVVRIKDTSHEEIIQLGDNDYSTYQLMAYNGAAGALIYSYTNATIYLQFPAFKNPNQIDIRLPGISVWGIDPEPLYKKLEIETETFRKNTDDFLERTKGHVYNFNILVSCEAHHAELIDKMTRIIRKLIGRGFVYINGRKHDLIFNGSAQEMRPEVGFDIINKVQYPLQLELEENIYDRVVVKKATNQTINVTIEEQ